MIAGVKERLTACLGVLALCTAWARGRLVLFPGAMPCRGAAAVMTCLFCGKCHTQPMHVFIEAVLYRRAAAGNAATPRGTREPNGASRCMRERSASASPPEAEARDADAADAEAAVASSDNVKVPLWLRPGPFCCPPACEVC